MFRAHLYLHPHVPSYPRASNYPGAFPQALERLDQSKDIVRKITLSPEKPTQPIGRSSSNAAKGLFAASDNGFFDSPVMSRAHAEITLVPESKKLIIRDTKSMHGTFVNGLQLRQDETAELKADTELTFGADVTRGDELFPAKTFRCGVEWEEIPAAKKTMTGYGVAHELLLSELEDSEGDEDMEYDFSEEEEEEEEPSDDERMSTGSGQSFSCFAVDSPTMVASDKFEARPQEPSSSNQEQPSSSSVLDQLNRVIDEKSSELRNMLSKEHGPDLWESRADQHTLNPRMPSIPSLVNNDTTTPSSNPVASSSTTGMSLDTDSDLKIIDRPSIFKSHPSEGSRGHHSRPICLDDDEAMEDSRKEPTIPWTIDLLEEDARDHLSSEYSESDQDYVLPADKQTREPASPQRKDQQPFATKSSRPSSNSSRTTPQQPTPPRQNDWRATPLTGWAESGLFGKEREGSSAARTHTSGVSLPSMETIKRTSTKATVKPSAWNMLRGGDKKEFWDARSHNMAALGITPLGVPGNDNAPAAPQTYDPRRLAGPYGYVYPLSGSLTYPSSLPLQNTSPSRRWSRTSSEVAEAGSPNSLNRQKQDSKTSKAPAAAKTPEQIKKDLDQAMLDAVDALDASSKVSISNILHPADACAEMLNLPASVPASPPLSDSAGLEAKEPEAKKLEPAVDFSLPELPSTPPRKRKHDAITVEAPAAPTTPKADLAATDNVDHASQELEKLDIEPRPIKKLRASPRRSAVGEVAKFAAATAVGVVVGGVGMFAALVATAAQQ